MSASPSSESPESKARPSAPPSLRTLRPRGSDVPTKLVQIRRKEGSLGRDGHRKRPYPADVRGRFARARRIVAALLLVNWIALPWIPIHGHPAVFLDVTRRQFFLFGMTFNAQDAWLLFFALTGAGFLLLFLTAVLGRVFCGWACPQTVFLEFVFRPIERLIMGPRTVAIRRAQAPMNADKALRTIALHVAFVVTAFVVAHVFLAYFVSLPGLYAMVRANPGAHPEAFAWAMAVTGLLYGNFAFFREQLCVVICPYGRLQSVLLDDDSLVVGYDERRGEPRGKATRAATAEGAASKGDCVDCGRCVTVCPTGIDIREGLQLDCVACTACIDACDEIMTKLKRPTGLIRYDSLRGLAGQTRRFARPRLYVYSALLLVGIVVGGVAFSKREPFEAHVTRVPGAPYTRDGGELRNGFSLHIVNKSSEAATFSITPERDSPFTFVLPIQSVAIPPLGSERVPLFVAIDEAKFTGDRTFHVQIRRGGDRPVTRDFHAVFLGAKR